LRKFTGKDLVIYSKKQYQLLPGSISTDRRQFEDAIRQIQKKSIDHSMLTLIEKALALYQGDYLGDLDYFWLIPIQEDLKNKYIDLTRKTVNYYLEQRQYSQAVTHLRRLAKFQPYSEENLVLLMTALAGMGDLQGLKEQYHIFEKNISEDLGLAPSTDTKLMYLKLCNNNFD
jgi:two-component SAPR family response regulator